MNKQQVDFLVELGDFKDQGQNAQESIAFLQTIEAEFARFEGPRHHALGNHDMDNLSKAQFLANITNTGFASAQAHYSFDTKGVHLVVLDANFRADGTDYNAGNFDWTQAYIPAPQRAWLQADLAGTQIPTIVFIHQLLDGDGGDVYVKNAAEVRQILEASGKVRAVFQGHHHTGAYTHKNGIHYYTLKGLIEGTGPTNSAYAIVRVMADGSLDVTGYRKAESRLMAAPPPFLPVAAVSLAVALDTRLNVESQSGLGVKIDTLTKPGTLLLAK